MATASDLSPEEQIDRMTDEELLGLTPPASRPGSGPGTRRRSKPGLSALVPPSAVAKPASRPASAGRRPSLALGKSESAPAVGALRPCSAEEVKAQRKQSFHFKRQRRWLEIRNKQHCLSFTEQEINDFRRFFDALSKGKDTITVDRFEDMLVCLDMAKSKKDVRLFFEGGDIKRNVFNYEIHFEDFLKAFESQLDIAQMDVLKRLLHGSYDSRELDYTTFISERRRELIFSATGARGSQAQGPSKEIVRTFADLLEDRCYEDFGMGQSVKSSEDGVMLMGGLATMWNMACVQHGLSRQMTAEERIASFKKSIPLSPRTVVSKIVKSAAPKAHGVRRVGGTLIIEADGVSM